MWFGAETIFSKQQQKQMNTFCHINEVSYYFGEGTAKDSMKANELELKMERFTLKCLENLQMASCSAKETEKQFV